MKSHNGQILIEFLLISIVLLIVVSGVFSIYKKFWKEKYNKIAKPSTILSATLKTPRRMSYVK
jgi:uncharacterized protein (UPF0333 family)